MENTNRMQLIGMALMFLLFITWVRLTGPSEEQIVEHQRVQDSILLAQEQAAGNVAVVNTPQTQAADFSALPDSVQDVRLAVTHGPFAASASGTEETFTLENDKMTVVFSSKGGKIKEVTLKEHFKILTDSLHEESKGVLKLLEDTKNKFEYFLPIANLPAGGVKTSDLYFQGTQSGNTITFRAPTSTGGYFEQKYTLSPDNYLLDYDIQLQGLNGIVNADNIQLNWVNYLDRLEKNTKYERNYSSVYFKAVDDDVSYCTCTSDSSEDIDNERVQWISQSNQFFNSALIAKDGTSFKSAFVSTEMFPEDKGPDLKKLNSEIQIPIETGGFSMAMYVGPNEFDRLRAIGHDFEDVIPFGSSIFGTVNRWIVRPLFGFLSQFIGSKGLVIILLTFLIKMVLYPLTYKMVYSQQKMAALKPRMAKMKDKHKDDPQAAQMETMKMYREYGVNPVGGCLPMIAQMPIWIALFRFFPASIEFRQEPFLWASDLSSYDVFYNLPFEIPFYGAHVSLLTILWAGTTVLYTVYNSKQMDMSAMGGGDQAKMMMYMQYFMPVMFLFFFNNYASGLTTYMLFSNLLNVGQMVATKEFIIDKKKIESELVNYQKKPKKKSGFGQRLEQAMKEQQKALAAKEAGAKRKKK